MSGWSPKLGAEVCPFWSGLVSLDCEEGTVLQDVYWGVVLRSALSGHVWCLWTVKRDSPTGCVLGCSVEVCHVWCLWTVKRGSPTGCVLGCSAEVCPFWTGLVSLDCEENPALCVLAPGPSSQVWVLSAVKRWQSWKISTLHWLNFVQACNADSERHSLHTPARRLQWQGRR